MAEALRQTIVIRFPGRAKALGELSPSLMRRLQKWLGGKYQEIVVERAFDRKGPGWAPLSRGWRERKVRSGKGSTANLKFSGKLKKEATKKGNIKAEEESFEIIIRLPYAAIHNFGGFGVPARPYLKISRAQLKQLAAFAVARLAFEITNRERINRARRRARRQG